MPQKQDFHSLTEETTDPRDIEPIRKSIRIRASAAHAFRVFAEEMDSWWPRTHHTGNAAMEHVVVEGHPMGTIYTEQEDGTICPWGTVLIWDPPHRFVMAWRVDPTWKYESDLEICSEVELRFLPTDDGVTILVELEHRELQLHGTGFTQMREQVNAEDGWGLLLSMFAKKAEVEF